ncbi:hypothetical protein F5Y15DRAFT_150321 [Xylariaceae sp. FL0016]|nr:hypothetical protein F5Y15DRAFT_150321 [Xylariaceae sp. FL0016]
MSFMMYFMALMTLVSATVSVANATPAIGALESAAALPKLRPVNGTCHGSSCQFGDNHLNALCVYGYCVENGRWCTVFVDDDNEAYDVYCPVMCTNHDYC